jgi:hypothetical protein
LEASAAKLQGKAGGASLPVLSLVKVNKKYKEKGARL